MKTKFLAMILAVLMLLVSFAGCGKERTAEDMERITVPQINPQETNEEGEEWTEGTNEQNRS